MLDFLLWWRFADFGWLNDEPYRRKRLKLKRRTCVRVDEMFAHLHTTLNKSRDEKLVIPDFSFINQLSVSDPA